MHKIKLLMVTLTVLLILMLSFSNIASAAHKVSVNHVDVTAGTSKVLCISANALQAHLNHGDTIVDVDQDGVADTCSP